MFRNFRQLCKLRKSRLAEDEFYEIDANDRGVIDVGAENYDDVFSYYDLDGENVLDMEFDDFLEAKADAIPMKTELALHFHVKDATEEKRDEIDRTIKNHYKRQLRALNRKLHRNTMFTLYMLLLAVISFGIYIPLVIFDLNFAVVEIFDIIAWVFVWEAVDNHFLSRRNIQLQRLKKYRLIRADIEVREYHSKKQDKQKYKAKRKSDKGEEKGGKNRTEN